MTVRLSGRAQAFAVAFHLRVELRVQDDVFDAFELEQLRQPLRLLDRDRADQCRLADLALFGDGLGDGLELVGGVLVELVFLVDPLDGTKEFARGGDDYTVNIGLILAGLPTLGIVYAPATGRLHRGLALKLQAPLRQRARQVARRAEVAPAPLVERREPRPRDLFAHFLDLRLPFRLRQEAHVRVH